MKATQLKRKNPLHPSALAINDLRRGCSVVRFNTEYGTMEEGVVVREPYVQTHASRFLGKQLMVDIRPTEYGDVRTHFLSDTGTVPYEGGLWSPVNFMVAAKKKHLLPEPSGPNPESFVGFSDFEDYFENEFDRYWEEEE